MKIGITYYSKYGSRCVLALFVLLCAGAVYPQGASSPLAPMAASRRALLKTRLFSYTEAYRNKDWAALYDLVSDQNKIGPNQKLKVTKRIFVRDMQGTYDPQRLIKFTPVRTEPSDLPGAYDIYGCAKIPYGNEKLERIVAVRAVWEHENWFFENWDHAEPPEDCSHLSDPAWKPRFPLKLDGPMLQVTCELYTCTL
jgi:hypothetical protein